MERVICSRIGRFNACVKHGQLENSLSYCVLRSELRRSERALRDIKWVNFSYFSGLFATVHFSNAIPSIPTKVLVAIKIPIAIVVSGKSLPAIVPDSFTIIKAFFAGTTLQRNLLNTNTLRSRQKFRLQISVQTLFLTWPPRRGGPDDVVLSVLMVIRSSREWMGVNWRHLT